MSPELDSADDIPARDTVDWASVVLLGAVIALTGISLPIMSLALPALADAYPAWSTADLSWVTNIFTIVGAGTMIPAGVLADRIGRKRLVVWGCGVFLVGSVVGALATGPAVVITARAIQALGASAFTPAGAAMVVAAFPADRMSTAMGCWAVAGGVASSAGPGLGGIIIDGLGWRWAFWVVVPLAVVVFALGPRILKEPPRRDTHSTRFPDPLGVALVIVSATLLTFGLVKGPGWGWVDGRTVACLASGAVLGAVLVWRIAHVANPLLDPRLFSIPTVRLGNLATFVFAGSWFGMFFGLVLFLRVHWGWSLLDAGLATSPIALLAGLVGAWAGRRADRVGHRAFILPGTVLYAATALWFGLMLDDEPSLAAFLPGAIAVGVSSGLVFPSVQAVTLFGVPARSHAVASSLMFAVQRLAISFGVALVIGLQGEDGRLAPVLGVMVFGAVGAFALGSLIDTRPART